MPSFPRAESEAACFIAWLRDQLGAGTVVDWSGDVPATIDTTSLHHLPPPRESADPRVGAWRAAFRPALCYYRNGPGFMEVRDLRRPGDAVRMTITDERLIDTLRRCAAPVPASELDQAILDLLTSEHLVLRVANLVLTAPYRMTRWPVPARGV
jgi:hypothetical protein